MKIASFNLLLCLFLQCNFLSGQNQTVIIDHSHCQTGHFKWGEMYYSASFKGLKMMMHDIGLENPELHAKMIPVFNNLEKKKRSGNSVLISTNAVGGFMLLGSLTFLRKNEIETSIFFSGITFYKPPKEVKTTNTALLATGSVLMLTGTIIGMLLYPKEQDIYDFINLHNRNSTDKKIDWKVRLNCTHEQTLGLAVQLRF